MGARDGSEFLWAMNSDERGEIADVRFVRATGSRVVDVGEPLDFWWDVGKSLELGIGQPVLLNFRSFQPALASGRSWAGMSFSTSANGRYSLALVA